MDLVTGSKAMLLIGYMHLFVVRVVPVFLVYRTHSLDVLYHKLATNHLGSPSV